MKQIQQIQCKKTIDGRAKVQSRINSNFTSLSKVSRRSQAISSDSYLFQVSKTETLKPKKIMVTSKEQMKSILISKRDAYLSGTTTRHSKVMKLVKSVVRSFSSTFYCYYLPYDLPKQASELQVQTCEASGIVDHSTIVE